MIKILHSADWHLDSPLAGDEALKKALLRIPEQVVQVCKEEGCQLMLLSGDLFDGKASPESIACCKRAFQEAGVPVFISPGNHDYIHPDSPYIAETWPENVHIFTKPELQSLAVPELNCRIYGAGFDGIDCPPLLEGFQAQGEEACHIAVVHGDPTVKNSPYNPITASQVGASGLSYLALGHIHKGSSMRAKGTLCAWPGCPMGRGFDETEEKGVLVVTLGEKAELRFVPLDTPRFYDITAEILTDADAAVAGALPAVANDHHYRIRLTGEAEAVPLSALQARFSQFPHLELRDETVPPTDPWGSMGADSLEGEYFRLLHEAMEQADEETRCALTLAARISRKLLDGREVQLP